MVFNSGTGKHMGVRSGTRARQCPLRTAILAPRWLKTIEFGQMFLISMKESVTSGTQPNEVVHFETITGRALPVVQLQWAHKKVRFIGRLKYSSFGQTRVFT